MPSWPKKFAGTGAALLCGVLLRGYFLWHHPRFGGDTLIYGNLAHNLAAHHVYSFDEATLQPTLIRLPGYPLFLAAVFLVFGDRNYVAVILIQALVDLFGCWLLHRLAERLAGTRAGFATLWLACLCPFTANYTATALTETLSIFSVTLGAVCLERWMEALRGTGKSFARVAGIGSAMSAAVLLRPDGGLLAAALLPVMLWVAWRRPLSIASRLRGPLLAVFLMAAPLAVWGVRNWMVFHVVQPLAPRYANDPGETVPLGFQRWYRTWAVEYKSTFDTYWNYDGAAIQIENLPARAFDTAAQKQRTAELIRVYDEEQSSTLAFDAAFAQIAAERTAAHPVRTYVLLPVARVVNMWLRPRTEWMRVPLAWWYFAAHPWASTGALGYALLNAVYLLLAIAGWFHRKRFGRGENAVLALGLLAFVLLRSVMLLNLDNSEPRYTLECYPVVVLFAGLYFARGRKLNGE